VAYHRKDKLIIPSAYINFIVAMKCVIGTDIGTSSAKAVALTEDGKVITTAQESYSILQPKPNYQEQVPQTLLQATLFCIGEIITRLKNRYEIAGFSFSCAMHGIMAVNEKNEPVTNLITWADTRSILEAEELKQSTWAGYLYRQTGVPIHPMSPLCKIAWMRQHQPQVFEKAAKFISFKEYLFYYFFGKYIIDYSMASATGLFDIHELKWNEMALALAGITESQLSLPVTTTHTEYDIAPAIKERWDLPSKTPFIIGSSDGCLANLGTGAITPGDAAITVGTSGAVRVAHQQPEPDQAGRTFNYVLSKDLYISGGPINNGGIILKWFAENFLQRSFEKSADFEWFLQEASKAEPGCGGLICLPYFLGERAPVWDAETNGVFIGVQLHHKREHFMRAIVEGISMSLYQITEILHNNSGPVKNIYASGGFVRSNIWMQIIANIFKQPVYITNTSDASSIGAAMLGWHALGKIKSLREAKQWVQVQQSFYPDGNDTGKYQKNYEIFTRLYNEWKDIYKK
jgi:gluconokinase